MSLITYLNKPKLSEHEVDSTYNERRLTLVSKLDSFLSGHPLFKNKDIKVSFVQKGVSSLVCILETVDEKLVLKIPLRMHATDSEGLFLKTWEKVGVSVPHVLEEGKINGHSYILMRYIDAPSLRDFYKLDDLLKENIFIRMGEVLRQMHRTEGRGYGRGNAGRGEFSGFKEWLGENAGFEKKFSYVRERELLNDKEHGSLEKACEILVDFVQKDGRITYCHNDFAIENIFATTPMTVFDPDPMFNHPYIDLARTIVIGISFFGREAADQLIEGYFQNENYDKKILSAAILLGTYMKFGYWHKTKQKKRIEFLQEYASNYLKGELDYLK